MKSKSNSKIWKVKWECMGNRKENSWGRRCVHPGSYLCTVIDGNDSNSRSLTTLDLLGVIGDDYDVDTIDCG